MNDISLKFGLKFSDLYSHHGLIKVDNAFNEFIETEDDDLLKKIFEVRKLKLSEKEYSSFIIEVAPYLEKFICEMFNIEPELEYLKNTHDKLSNIYKCKRLFVQRQAIRYYGKEDWSEFNPIESYNKINSLLGNKFSEIAFSNLVMEMLDNKEQHATDLDMLSKYSAWACLSKEGKRLYKHWALFKIPAKKDLENALDIDLEVRNNISVLKAHKEDLVSRDGFSLTSEEYGMKEVLDQTNYCIYCHKQDKDSCSKGLKEHSKEADKPQLKKDIFGSDLAGCPLEEKISEMNFFKSHNINIGSLAAAIIDNPMVAATGHRICNDCMQSCIYQKQAPVNIPQAETGILRDVLNLPWGFEIYRLLTQWNPLKITNHIIKESTNSKILVVGLGPAGFTLAHYLLTEGHTVVAIDGLKIEHLDPSISGIDFNGNRVPFIPIKNINDIFEDLEDRVPYGFGGVAEYGITVRWDKNFLKIIRLILERNTNFRMFGGTRFGSNIDYKSAFSLGFDHISLSMGAGRPNILDIPNALALGVRAASDFLMSLQLTGAAKKTSVSNLQIRLPIVVVGGGLTAIDTATESMTYYIRQVEKFSTRYKKLVEFFGKDFVEKDWNDLDKEIAREFIAHAEIFQKERSLAATEGRLVSFAKIIQTMGGVKLIYRKAIQNAPSYRLNPEEVDYAFKEGIEFIENAVPREIKLDRYEYINSVECLIGNNIVEISAKTLLVATGTNPNTVLTREDPENFLLEGKYFKILEDSEVIISKNSSNGNSVSVFGDLHPKYKGNVVKAMASAKNHYKAISDNLVEKKKSTESSSDFLTKINNLIMAKVYQVNILTQNIVEVIFEAPLAAQAFQPGQFYKLQNYDQFSIKQDIEGEKTNLLMEGIALTGAWVDKKKGLISTIILEMGGSSDLCRFLKKGEPVVLMGPTGEPTEIKSNEKVILVGGGLGNAVLFSIGQAFREAGSKVLYFAGYKKVQDRFKVEEIEKAADQVVWCCDDFMLTKNRKNDMSFHGNIVDAIDAYSSKKSGLEEFDIENIDRIISIGSSGMMEAVNRARQYQFKSKLKQDHKSIASINSPMQCMMKEICAQCLQKHIDPNTGIETYVYSCVNQDQDSDKVDFKHLQTRLSQNSLSEKITSKWIDYTLRKAELRT